MSVPLYFDDPFFDDVMRDFGRHRPRVYDQHFGMGVRRPTAEDYMGARRPVAEDYMGARRPVAEDYLPAALAQRRYASPRAPVVLHRQNSGSSELTAHKDRVEMRLDVQHFTPDELKVTISDGRVVVEAKHEEKQDDHGHISRQFTRRYDLPEDVDEDAVVSHLSKEGVLTITAPRKVEPEEQKPEKSVPLNVEKGGKTEKK